MISYIEIFRDVPDIKIVTGLGYSKGRLRKILDNISKYKQIKLVISGESLGKNYEFNRYGNTYNHFLEMLDIIKSYTVDYSFNTTYSNITVFDYVDFYENFQNIKKTLNLVYDPTFMSIEVMDHNSKDLIRKQIENSSLKNTQNSKSILSGLDKDYSEEQRKNLEIFVKEFCKRRKITLDFAPNSFKTWLNLL